MGSNSKRRRTRDAGGGIGPTPAGARRGIDRGDYELTLQGLEAISPDDDDDPVRVIGDWTVEFAREKERLPVSRDVRRRAMKLCRANGDEVRSGEWLGIQGGE